MADSDDEYDRRRARDKFRRERSDYQDRRDDRGRREDFPERDSWNNRDRGGRRDYRDYDPRGRRDRYSPPPPRHDISPPMKRIRRDWVDDRGGGSGYMGGNYDMGYHGGGGGMMHHGNWGSGGGGMHHDMNMMHGDAEPGITQPPMMTFKQFLGSQDDTIDDQEAVKKYNEYKVDFRKQQLSEFFINHKEEEWFKSKYHPEEFGKRKGEQHQAISRRLNVFLELYELNWLDNITVDVDKSEAIIRYLDAVVIKLEGGNENDLRAVDEPYVEEKLPESPPIQAKDLKQAGSDDKDDEKKSQEENADKKESELSESKESRSGDEDSSDDSSSESSDSDDDSEEEEEEKSKKDMKEKEKKLKKKKKVGSDTEEGAIPEEENEKPELEKSKSEEVEEMETELTETVEKEAEADNEHELKDKSVESSEETNKADVSKEKEEVVEDEGPPKPRHLHRTCSIFLRNLAPTITKEEVEDMCKKHPGFLRVAINDPQPDRRFFRRGWVTFERNVNIKDICWNLNTLRLRDCELGAIVNRDLSRRIRSVNGITSHKTVMRADIKIAAKIVQNLDWQKALWVDGKPASEKEFTLNLISKNPLLRNITDYLIEEANAEEEELLGVLEEQKAEGEEASAAPVIERDEMLIKVLDRLLFYLRVVHSVDYYNHSDYPNEDEMPNRCGIMHARGSAPNNKVTQVEINEYMTSFEQKISPFLQTQPYLAKDEAVKLGLKDPEAEVEKFIQANTQELGKEKWLCPLSGKKFKGPDFIRKHIFNKHHEKVEEVRQEVEYFNNYLLDSKRPQLPEHPSNRQPTPMPGGPMAGRTDMHHMGGGAFMGYPPAPHFGGFTPRGHPPNFGGFGRNNFPDNRSGAFVKRNNFGRTRGEQRKLINYKDLDAPSETDLY